MANKIIQWTLKLLSFLLKLIISKWYYISSLILSVIIVLIVDYFVSFTLKELSTILVFTYMIELIRKVENRKK